jgi:hypothetical protein
MIRVSEYELVIPGNKWRPALQSLFSDRRQEPNYFFLGFPPRISVNCVKMLENQVYSPDNTKSVR